MKTHCFVLVIAAIALSPTRAQPFEGADAILKRLAEQAEKKPDAAKQSNPVEELR